MTEFTKKAAEMLLKGATLVREPCPYCKGVRIMKDGNAFCANCGRESKEDNVPQNIEKSKEETITVTPHEILDQKLKDLADELQQEKDYAKQQQILKSINDIIAAKEKLKHL